MVNVYQKFQGYYNALFSKFWKDTAIVTISTVLSRGIGFLTFLIIAKSIGVSDYGIVTVLLALNTTITELINSGLNASLIRYTSIYNTAHDMSKISRLYTTNIINVVLISVVLIGLLSLFSHSVSMLLFKEDFALQVILSGVGILTTFVFSIYSGILQGLEKFKDLLVSSNVFSIAKLIGVCLLLKMHLLNINSILILFVVSPLAGIAFGHFFISKNHIRFSVYDKKLVKEIFGFSKWIILWSVVAAIQSRLDLYLLGPLRGSNEVSYFDIAQKFMMVIAVFASAYGSVLNPKLSGMHEDRMKIHKSIASTTKVCIAVTILLVIGSIFLPELLPAVLGEKYSPSKMPLRILLVAQIFFIWSLPFNSVLYAIGKSKVFFILAIAGLAVNVICSVLLIPALGAIGSSIAFFVVSAIGLVISLFYYNKYFRVHLKKQPLPN